MHTDAKCRGFFSAVTQAHGSNHIAFAGSAHTGATSGKSLVAYFVPKIQLCVFHLVGFRVGLDFRDNLIDFFHLKVNDVVHHSLCASHMVREKIVVKLGLVCEWIIHIRI